MSESPSVVMKCFVSGVEEYIKAIQRCCQVARDFNHQLKAVEELKIPVERLDYWQELFTKMLDGNEDLALEWLQYACASVAEATCSARECLHRIERMIAERVGAGVEKPRPPVTMVGQMWKKIEERKQT